MFFKRYRSQRSAFLATMLACLSFIALAIWGWSVPVKDVLVTGVLVLVMVLLLIGCAALLIFIVKSLGRLFRNDKD